MFLRDLHIQNLKLLRDFRLSFEDVAGEPRMWTVLIGENGTAKSSILQAIAMASAGRLLVNSLAKPVIGQLYDRRRLEDDSDEPMRITARFAAQPSSDLAARSLEAQVTLQRNQATLRRPPCACSPNTCSISTTANWRRPARPWGWMAWT